MKLRTARALPADTQELLGLYFMVYGRTYPLAVGTDAAVMAGIINHPDHLWLVIHDDDTKKIVGSLVAEQDLHNRIGRLQALVIHPDYRRLNLASKLAEEMVHRTVGPAGTLNSLYTTTRTVAIGPQAIFLNLQFLPLGVFPNAHCVKNYETLTLLARFREGVLEGRPSLPRVTEKLSPILEVLNSVVSKNGRREILTSGRVDISGQLPADMEFELIYAPDFVKRRFLSQFADPYDSFYPFHDPNLLISTKGDGPDIYAYFGKQDGYCTLVGGTEPFWRIGANIETLVTELNKFGASYIETLLSVSHTNSLQTLMDHQFLPSAVYPAMLELDGEAQDFVLLSRTAEPLSFKGMALDHRFKPYIDQFVRQWSQMHIDAMEVIDDRD